MLKGDLATTPIQEILTDLASSDATGCLHIEGPDADEALVYFKSGAIYSTFLPGRRPHLGARLISSGALAPEALEEALEAQATELQGWRLGELLVHLGFVEAPVVEAFGVEQVRDACFEMSRWDSGKWKFRKNEKTREDISASLDAKAILDEILRREQEWQILTDVIRGTDSVPILGAGGLASADLAIDQDEWALLCKVDGERSIHQLARDCGFTDFEAGQIVSSLVVTGLLEIEAGADNDADLDEAPISPRSAAERLMAAFSGGDTDPAEDEYDADGSDTEVAMPSYLSSLVTPLVLQDVETVDEDAFGAEVSRLMANHAEVDLIDDITVEDFSAPVEAEAEPANVGYTSYALPPVGSTDFEHEPYADPDASLPRYSVGFGRRDFDDSLSAVSEALSALLGNQPEAPVRAMTSTAYVLAGETEEEMRARVLRDAAAAEMSAAHAEMEEQRRRFDDARKRAEETAQADADAEHERLAEEVRAQEHAERLLTAEADRVAAEAAAAAQAAEEQASQEAAHAEAARLYAEAEADRAAAEAEAARRAEQEAAHAADEAARAAAEQEAALVAAEAAAAAAVQQEAARIATEEAARVAAEEAARLAADEAARVAAEQEAAALAAEEAAQQAAQAQAQAEADEEVRASLAEQHRLVAEVDARVAAEQEAARHAEQQQADSTAAEQESAAAAADEAVRVAAAESARVAAEHEAVRLAEEEAARVAAAEQEAARIAAEEAARVATEQEAARLVAEQETARVATEERARIAAEQAVAAALMALEQSSAPAPPPPPVPAGAPVMTDTASLMRELSSLGFDDEPAPAPTSAPSRPSPVGAAARSNAAQADKGKKRKGLFGRG